MFTVEIPPRGLADRVREWEFQPEIYTYPTPRMYDPLPNFCFDQLRLTREINVYVHVPFCRQFCTFCGYFKTMYDESLQEQFVEAVVAEIRLRRSCLSGKVIKTLHFGGGTPSLLTAAQLGRIVEALREANPALLETCLEVSIEATPESVERDRFLGYRQAGINRVSMGVQSLVDAEVRLANRCSGFEKGATELLRRAVGTLHEIGIPDVVIDLMIGIEGQSQDSFVQTLESAIALRPETVQLYALGVMPQTALGRRRPQQMMSGQEIYACYEHGREHFLAAGYRRDSHDRYSLHPVNGFLQGDLNIKGMSLVGLGAGARSYAENWHVRNTYTSLNGRKALLEYMALVTAGRSAVESGVPLVLDERMRQYAIGHLQALDCDEFSRRFGQEFEEVFGNLIPPMLDLDLAHWDRRTLRLTEKGLLFRDLIGRAMFSRQAEERESVYR